MTKPSMTKDEFRAAMAIRLRQCRKAMGYETAASFARAIGYRPGKYRRYERRGFVRPWPMVRLVRAIEEAGLGRISLDWLLDVDSSVVGRPVYFSRPKLSVVKPDAA